LEVKGRGRAKFKAHRKTLPTPEYTLRGFTLRDGRLRLPAGVSRRRRARGQAPSKGCLQARRQAAKLHQKGARQTLHDSGIWAKRGVEHPQVIAVEDFKALFLATFTMARKSADAAIGAATAELIDRGTRAGATVVRVAPAYRAMMCSRCWQRQARLRLARRTFRCARCGFTAGRDRNAAAVTLATAERIRGGVDDVRHVPPPLGLVASAVRARNPQASAAGNR
jgi:putative transposase